MYISPTNLVPLSTCIYTTLKAQLIAYFAYYSVAAVLPAFVCVHFLI